MQNQTSFKPGFDLLLAFGATIASCTLAGFLCAIDVTLFFILPDVYKNGLTNAIANSVSFFKLIGCFAAFFCFASTFIPNMVGLYLIIRGSLKGSSWTDIVLGPRWWMIGAFYGLLISGLSLFVFGYFASSRFLNDILMVVKFFALLSPAAIVSGVLALQIVKMMLRSTLQQNPNISSLNKP